MEEQISESKKTKKKHHDAPKEYLEHKQHKQTNTYKIMTWVLAGVAIIFAVLFIVSTATGGFGGNSGSATTTGKIITADEAKAKATTVIQGLVQGQTVTIKSVEDKGSIYALSIDVGGQQFNSYITKDGTLLFPSAVDTTGAAATPTAGETATQPQPTSVPKTDKPVVELFVMSHCPYGTQSEKGILPAVRTLGDKIDFKIRFVYYAMHGEKEVKEQLVQYCIQKEEPTKYLPYLACFLNDSAGQGNEAASTACIASTKVDTAKVDACKIATDKEFSVMANLNDQASWLSGRFPKFNTDLALNTKYAIQGSPTLVINGAQSNAGRDAASYLKGICAAFTTAPAECNTQLSTTSPGPGFGYDSVGAANAAGCGV